MRVEYDSQIFLRQRVGGISRYFSDLISEFALNPELGVTPKLHFRITNNRHLTEKMLPGVVRQTPDWMPRSVLYSAHWLRGRTRQTPADVIHHTYYSGRFLGRRSRAKIVVTVYDMIPELFWQGTREKNAHLRKREYINAADLVIFISEATRRDAQEIYGVTLAHSVVIPLAVGSNFQPGLPALPGLPSEYLLYIGGRKSYKSFHLLPLALRDLDSYGVDIPVVIVGSDLTSDELNLVKDCNLEGRFLVCRLNDGQLAQVISNCLALVQTSSYEGFGLTPLEGMASGVPVIVARASAMPEVGGDAVRYFEPASHTSLAEAILEVVGDSRGAKELADLGLARAMLFTPRVLAERTANSYRSITASN